MTAAADRLRPANIARAAGAVASRAADTERRADRATRTPPGSPARGDALLATDEAFEDAHAALRDLAELAADELTAHPLGARAHAATEAVRGGALAYAGALLAHAQAWRAGGPAPHPDAPRCLACGTHPQEVGRGGLCEACDAENGL